MNRWFRVYESLVDHPKIQRLPDPLFRAVINLWCVTSSNGGALPPVEDIAFQLRMSVERVTRLIDELRGRALIDAVDGRLVPHNWQARQFKSDRSNERVSNWREQRRNDARNVTADVPSGVTPADDVTPGATPPDSETESESESQNTPSSSPAAREGEREIFRDFCQAYPARDRPLNPDTTWAAVRQALRAGADPAELVASTGRFAEAERRAGRVGTRYVPTAERFLREGRWKGYPAPAARPPAAPGEGAGEGAGGPLADDRWAPVYAQLEAALGADVASSWFRNMRLVAIAEGVATLAAPTAFLRQWVDGHYGAQLLTAFRTVHGAAIARVDVLDPGQVRRPPTPQAPAEPVTASDRRAAEQELARQTVTTEGCRKVAVWLGTHELLPAIQEINGWLTQLGNDAVALAKILAEATHIGMSGKAALGWVRQQVKAHAAPNVLMHEPVEVKTAPDGAAAPIGKRRRAKR